MDTGDPKFVLVYANEDESNMATTNFGDDQSNASIGNTEGTLSNGHLSCTDNFGHSQECPDIGGTPVTWTPWTGKCKQEPVVVQSNVVVTSAATPVTVDSTDSREEFSSSGTTQGMMNPISASTPSTVQSVQSPVASTTANLAATPVVAVSSACSSHQISAQSSVPKCIQLPVEALAQNVSSGTTTLQINLAPGQANTATLQQVQQAVAAVASGLPGAAGGHQKILLQFHPSGAKAFPLTAFTTVLPTTAQQQTAVATQQLPQQAIQTQQIQLQQVQPHTIQQQQQQPQQQQQFQQLTTQQISLAPTQPSLSATRTVQLQPLTAVTGTGHQGQTVQFTTPLTVQALHPSGTILHSTTGTQLQLQALPQAVLNGGVAPVAMELAPVTAGNTLQEMKTATIALDMVDGASPSSQLTTTQLTPAVTPQPLTNSVTQASSVPGAAPAQTTTSGVTAQGGHANGTTSSTVVPAPTSSTGGSGNAAAGTAPTTTTPNKPFACQYCPKSFHNKQQLIVHIRTHTGERPFACKTCGKAYRQKGQLTRHMMDHTGLRPYPCLWCSKAFKRKEHLHIHTKMVHKKVPVNNPPVNPVK